MVGLLGLALGLTAALIVLIWTGHRSLIAAREYLAQGQGEFAAQELGDYLRFHPKNAEGWMLMAQAQANLNDLDACLHSLQQVPENSSQAAEAKFRIGEVLHELARDREAEQALTESIAMFRQRSNNVPKLAAQSVLLNIYLVEERWEEAEELLWDMYHTWPPLDENAKPLLVALLGLKFNRTPPEIGASKLAKLVKQDPEDDRARRMLGKYYIQLGRSTEGKSLIQQSVARHPDDVVTRTLWIWCLYELGDPDAAAVALEPLPAGWENRVELWTYRARAHYELGQWDEAIACGREALARDAFDRQAHFQLARALRRIGQNDESQRHNQIADELRLAEEKRLSLFEDVTVARRSHPTVDDCRTFAELCFATGVHRLAREFARFALVGDEAPSLELLKLMPLVPKSRTADSDIGSVGIGEIQSPAGVHNAP